MERNKITIIFIGLLTMLPGCYPDGPDYVEDLDLVVTQHDTSFDFQTLSTFAIPDTVVKITGNLASGEPIEFVNQAYATIVVNSIRENLTNDGWTEVAKNANPDVIILPSTIQSTTTVYYYDYGYWGWYYPYSYWGWYYPYPIYGGSYTSGSVFIQMTYPAGQTASDNIPVIWTAILNGLLEGSTSSIQSRVVSGINTSFQASPYLNLNNE